MMSSNKPNKNVKVFEYPDQLKDLEMDKQGEKDKAVDWRLFLDKFAGCLADDPIARGDQGKFEIREKFESYPCVS